MRGEFIEVSGRRLYYYAAGTRGAGDPVILLHGFPTTGHLWHAVVPLLPRGHRVVVVDLLGYGRSDRPGDADLSLAAHARRLVAFMDSLGIASATIVGHHLGGGVAMALAAGWPSRVSHLGLLHSVGYDVGLTGKLAVIRAFVAASRLVPARAFLRVVRRELERWYGPADRARFSVEQYLRTFSQPGGLRAFFQHLVSVDPRDTEALIAALPLLRIPVSVVSAVEDNVIPSWVASRLHLAIPGSTLDFIADVRHFSPEEAPERIAGVIERLVAR